MGAWFLQAVAYWGLLRWSGCEEMMEGLGMLVVCFIGDSVF